MTEIIKISNVYKDYFLSDNIVQPVLKDINLSIYSGDFASVMGPSGSGKSTFMNILGCLDKPTKGDYFLNGRNVAKLDKDELADVRNRYIGFVFQGFNLLSRRTIFDNVTMPMIYMDFSYRERRKRAEEILESVKLKKYIDYYPNQLSGGMQQRVAIARALINNPTVIFADEPTGNLDTKTSDEIMKIFQDLNSNMGINIVMVTHEPDIAKYTKRLVFIRDGIKEHDCNIEEAARMNLV
jgi:putative ABC transport system ATP-binding protein